MALEEDPLSSTLHRKVGAALFNRTWELLDRPRRSREEDEEMIHSAHASRYHWGRVGRPVNFSIAEWQLARVYAVLGRAEPARFHARRALEVAQRAHLGRFYVAYAYEALARAEAVARRRGLRARYLKHARTVGEGIRDADDRRMLLEDLATVQ